MVYCNILQFVLIRFIKEKEYIRAVWNSAIEIDLATTNGVNTYSFKTIGSDKRKNVYFLQKPSLGTLTVYRLTVHLKTSVVYFCLFLRVYSRAMFFLRN